MFSVHIETVKYAILFRYIFPSHQQSNVSNRKEVEAVWASDIPGHADVLYIPFSYDFPVENNVILLILSRMLLLSLAGRIHCEFGGI